ncbi:MAG TPA: ectoine synthase [bacterium]|nr:ectoine synthase [bacterium]
MIVRTLEDTVGTDRDVQATTWSSRRLLLRKDGMGFSLHDTLIKPGTETPMWYQNHLEAVYCIEGEGEVETVSDGKVYQLQPGTVYALNNNDQHILRARTQMRMVCVFNPPVSGNEVHDETGAYPLVEEEPAPQSAS